MTILAIIQARMGSTRLPGKVTKEICGRPMLWHQIQRAKLATSLDKIIVATTDQPEDQPVIAVAQEAEVPWATGSADDVLDRLYQVAKNHGATDVVRLTGDCPLIDPEVIEQVVQYFRNHRDALDHVCLGPRWPEGLGFDIVSFDALERAWREAKKQYEREHVMPYITISGKFRIYRFPCDQDLSHLRLTVDEPADYQVVRAVYEELYPKHGHTFGLAEILDLYQRRPDIFAPNMEIPRNEGFFKSLEAEFKVLRYEPKPLLAASDVLWSRAQPLIPAGTQTLGNSVTQNVQEAAPKYLQRAQGCRVWDVDGNEYIDYPMAMGCVILGHNYPRVNDAIKRQLEDGISFSLTHPLEVELAELLTSVNPWSEVARFGKTGSDATIGAIRAARAYTGREEIFHCGYHGLHDWYIAGTSHNRGIPQGTIDLQFGFPYNDLEALEKLFNQRQGQVAAVIIEPYPTASPQPGFLEGVKQLAHDGGAVLIYDEINNGFKFQLGGVHQLYGVTPDMACFGNAMGNGMPISAIVGSREVMGVFDEVFYSSSFGGECLSLAASIATIKELEEKDVYSHNWEMGRRLQEGYNRMAWDLHLEHNTQIVGLPPLTMLEFQEQQGNESLLLKRLFQQETLKRGILLGEEHCISYSHSPDDIDMTLAAYYEALQVLKKALNTGDIESLLDGPLVQPVFRPQI